MLATLRHPRVVVEVLSPSTQGDDEGDKRQDFQSLSSLEAYVMVSQDRRRVVVHRRDADGRWSSPAEVYDAGQTIALPALSSGLPVDEIYETILDPAGRSLLR